LSGKILQVKIVLQEIKPQIWRRILIPGDSTFWDLHVAIQDSMGWNDTHLHAFRLPSCEIGIPDDFGFGDIETRPGWKVSVAKMIGVGESIPYEYDFGDGWLHKVTLEKVLESETGVTYPVCVAGKRACPPEDCGGSYGYSRLLEVLSNPKHPEHDEMTEWIGDDYAPEEFSPESVFFYDPKERLKSM
jgi:hypothetical protein